jgi:DNA-binding CsgD family transcriptional regulator
MISPADPILRPVRSPRMLVGRPGLTPLLIGRSAPLGRLTGLVREAGSRPVSGRPAVALVAGEAGVGKTRLLRELVHVVPTATVVLTGQAEPGFLGRPWELATAVLGEHPRGEGDLLPAVLEAAHRRIDGAPALVVFEDLHWADAESVTVFDRLAAAGPGSLVLIGSYRSDELSRRLPGGEMVARLERRQPVEQVRLEPLTRLETGAFLAAVYGRALPGTVVADMHAITGGNVFFLEEIVTAAGTTNPERLAEQPLPWSLAELVRRQLEGLSTGERRVIEAAAVLGPRASFDVLQGTLGLPEDELIDLLRELVGRDLLVEESDDEFRFRHALVRESVERQLLARERRRLHERALDAMGTLCCGDLADLARHAAGAGCVEQFVTLARDGVRHYLGRGSSYQALLLATDALAEAPDDTVLLEGAARAGWLLGTHAEAAEHAGHWYGLVRDGDPLLEAPAARVLARALHDLGREDELWPLVARIEELAEIVPAGEERAKCLALVAQIRMLHHQPALAIPLAERAIAEAEVADAKAVRAQALIERASALADVPGRRDEGEAAMREAIAEAEAAGDWVLASRGLNNLLRFVDMASPEVPDLLARLRTVSERAGYDYVGLAYQTMHAVTRAIVVADRAGAEEAAAVAAERVPGNEAMLLMWCVTLRALLAREAGQYEEAADALAAVDPAALGNEDRRWYAAEAFRVAGGRGDREEAERWLAELGAPFPWGNEMDVLRDVVGDVEAGLRSGLTAEVLEERLVGPLRPQLAGAGRCTALVDGLLALGHGDHATAAALLGGVFAEGMPPLSHPLVASLRVALARALAGVGRRTEAAEQARLAIALLDRWPGVRRDEAEALLRRLEGAAEGDGELTAREREVAALLAEGLSNAELARRLYISPKTAAVHVSNILAKLGMSSRAEVAAWAVRTGVAPGPGEG